MYWFLKFWSAPKTHVQAFMEVLTNVIVSMIPFMLSYFKAFSESDDSSTISLSSVFQHGQLYLISYGVFGPLLWLAFFRSDRPGTPARKGLGLLSVAFFLPVVFLIGIDPTLSNMNNSTIVSWSYWFYVFVILLNYLLLFFVNIDPPEPNTVLAEGAREMRRHYAEDNNAD